MTWKQFQRRPRLYKKIADEIEKIGSCPYYRVDRWFAQLSPKPWGRRDLVEAAKTSESARIYGDLLRLPEILRRYARFLEIASVSIREAFHTSVQKPTSSSTKATTELTEYIKDAGRGRNRLTDLATLLTATYEAFGIRHSKKPSSEGVNPETLRRQVDRNKRRSKQS
jgi:hypothetical protein